MLSKLTLKTLRENKKRTIVTIISVMFSSALLFGVGFMISTVRDSGIRETIEHNGNYHLRINQVKQKEKDIINNEENISNIIYETLIDEVEIESTEKMHDKVSIKLYGYKNIEDDYINLTEGNYPKEKNEIIIPLNFATDHKLKLSDTYKIRDTYYQVVGIYDYSKLRDYQYYKDVIYDNFYFYTAYQDKKIGINNMYITFKSTDKLYEKIDDLSNTIGRNLTYKYGVKEYDNITLNYSLINYYDPDLTGGEMAIFILSILLLSTILGIFCIVVIYNSFAISVNERKKMFGVLSSVGAYKNQILRSVLLEAIYVSIIGIPLGFLLSLLMTTGVVNIINNLISEFLIVPYHLAIYPSFMILSLIMIVVTIFISAYRPALKASLVTPIEAIRMNKDIKLNKRKLKSSKWIKKLFNVEGEIAYLNLKRNKKRYRVTMISIVISIVLFIVFSTYINFAITESNKGLYDGSSNYDIELRIEKDSNMEKIYSKIKSMKGIDEIVASRQTQIFHPAIDKNNYTDEYLKYLKDYNTGYNDFVSKITYISTLDNNTYKKLTDKYNLPIDKPILVNYGKFHLYNPETGFYEKETMFQVYKNSAKHDYQVCQTENVSDKIKIKDCNYQLKDVVVSNKYLGNLVQPTSILVPDNIYNEIVSKGIKKDMQAVALSLSVLINTDEYKQLDEDILKLIDEYPDSYIAYTNYKMLSYEQDMYFITIKLVMYTFLGFIALIAITSMFNTINTSMELRRSEFAMLRSVGISPSGFKKMILLESIFFGIKSLVYGLVISLIIIFGISQIFGLSYGTEKLVLPFPTMYFLITIVTVIIIIVLTMFYSIRKVRKDNIIETIRNESI